MSQDTRPCDECKEPVSYETGFAFCHDGIFCLMCRPQTGKGYTLADLQRMKDETAVVRAQREIDLVDQLGPDVYFAVKGGDGP